MKKIRRMFLGFFCFCFFSSVFFFIFLISKVQKVSLSEIPTGILVFQFFSAFSQSQKLKQTKNITKTKKRKLKIRNYNVHSTKLKKNENWQKKKKPASGWGRPRACGVGRCACVHGCGRACVGVSRCGAR